jgi:hypothetical protein
MLKSVTVLALFLSSGQLFADDHLSLKKEHFLKMLDARIAGLQEAKSCATAAETKEALRACHENLRKNQEKIKAESKEDHRKMLDERIKNLQEKREKLNASTGSSH